MTPSDPEFDRIFAAHLEALSERLVEVAKRLDHLDKCIDDVQAYVREKLGAHIRVVEMLLASAQKLMDAQVATVEAQIATFDAKVEGAKDLIEERSKTVDAKLAFPTRVVWIIVLASLSTASVGLLAQFCNKPESQRSFRLPTTPPPPQEPDLP